MHQEGPKIQQSFISLLSRGWNSLPGACSDLDLPRLVSRDLVEPEAELWICNTISLTVLMLTLYGAEGVFTFFQPNFMLQTLKFNHFGITT